MKKLFLSILLFPTFAFGQNIDNQLYDFKGIRLGITLEEFRSLKHPDDKQSKIVCTGDENSSNIYDLKVYEKTEQALGAIKCKWNGYSNNLAYDAMNGSLSAANTGYAFYNYTFLFIKNDKNNKLELYKFKGTTNNNAIIGIINALSLKWGTPTINNSIVQNGFGASFDKQTAIWNNGKSIINIEGRNPDIKSMTVEFIDSELQNLYLDKFKELNPNKPNGI